MSKLKLLGFVFVLTSLLPSWVRAQTAPTISTQPSSAVMAAGNNLTLTVAASGTPTPTYQWYLNGNPLSTVAGHLTGVQTASLTITGVVAADAGAYTVTVTNTSGSVTSNTANLYVFATKVQSSAATGATTSSFTANWAALQGATGYQIDVATTPTFGNSPSNTPNSYVSGFQSFDVGSVTSYTVSGLTEDSTYYYRVRPYTGQGTGNSTTLSQVIAARTVASPSTGYTGTAILNDLMPGASGTDWNAGLTTTDANSYLVPTSNRAVWWGAGTTSTTYVQNGSLHITAGTTRAILAYFQPSTSVTGLAVGETLSVTLRLKFADASGTPTSYPGSLRFGLLNSNGNGNNYNVALSNSTNNPARINAANFSATAAAPARGSSGYVVETTAAQTPSAATSISIWRRMAATYPNDGTTPNATLGQTNGSGQWVGPTSTSSTPASGAIANIVIPTGNIPNFYLLGNSSDTPPALPNDGTDFLFNISVKYVSATQVDVSYSVRKAGTATPLQSYTASQTSGTLTTAFDSLVILTNYSTIPVVAGLTVSRIPVVPTIGTQPASQAVTAGASASFTVAATSSDPISYQWQKRVSGGSFVDISGATSATLSLTAVGAGDAADYQVIVSNSGGAVTSSVATLTVNFPAAPTADAATAVGTARFTANWESVSGAAGYKYDVATDSGFTTFVPGYQDVDATTNLSAVVTGLSEATTYYYRVRAYNSYAIAGASSNIQSVTTTATPLTVSAPPANQTVAAGTDATFSIAVTSNTSVTYQWQSAPAGSSTFTDIQGATGASYTVTAPTDAAYGTQYRVVVTNAAGSSTSSVVTLYVLTPPTATAATSVTTSGFTANWTGTASATGYRLDVSTSNTFATFVTGYNDADMGTSLSAALSNLADNSTYYYRVRAVYSAGTSAASNTGSVTTAPAAPVISQNPVDQSVLVGDNASFSVSVAASSTSLSYQWQVETVGGNQFSDLTGETAATLNLTAVQLTDSGKKYRVVVTNSGGPVTSAAATLTVNAAATPASIVTDPQTQSVALGGTLTLTVIPGGTAPFTYVWQRGSTTLTDDARISGSATATLTITGLQVSDAGSYTVTVTNSAGHATSNAAAITVVSPPAAPVAGAPTGVTATGFTATWAASSGATDYRLDVSTRSDFANFITGYADLDVGTATSAAVSGLTANTAYYYRVRAANLGGTSSSSNTLSTATLVSISAQPTSQTVAVGGSANFSVVISGTAPVSYQWQLGTQNVASGGTSATLALTNVQTSDAGSYTVIVTNAGGSVTSTAATLTVVAAPAANAATFVTSARFVANWSAVASATGYALDVATDSGFANFVPGFQNLGVAGNSAIVTGLSGGTTYYYRVRTVSGSVTGANSNTVSATTLSAPAGNVIVHDTMSAATLHAGLTTDTNSYLVPTSAQAVWASFGSANTTYVQNTSLNLTASTAARAYAIYFEPATTFASIAPGDSISATITFSLTTTASPVPAGTAGDFRVALLNSGVGSNGKNSTGSNARYPVATSNSLTNNTNSPQAAGYTGYIASSQLGTASTSNTISLWQRLPTLGAIDLGSLVGPTGTDIATTTSFSQIGTSGGGTSGAIVGDGSIYRVNLTAKCVSATQVDLTYTLIKSDGTVVMSYTTSQTSGTLVTSFDTLVLEWVYNSKVTVLDLDVRKVLSAPTIATQPTGKSGSVGDTLTLSVVAAGSPTLSYQWKKGSSNLVDDANHISGSTTATLTLSSALLTDSGDYSVVITNGAGSVTSSTATLSIAPAAVGPSITTQPQPATVATGGSTTLSVVATGTAPLTYQWYHGTSAIANATSSSLTLSNIQASDAGSYTVQITNQVSSVRSSPAVVTVTPGIVTQPVNVTALTGSIATFTVVAQGAGPLTYQWQKSGVSLADSAGRISGSSTPVLTIANLVSGDAGTYTVIVTNSGGSITSTGATLTVDTRTVILPTQPTIPALVFSVLDYGASASGSSVSGDAKYTTSVGGSGSHAQTITDNASAIQSAINAAIAAGGGTVEIPAAAGVYYSGPITLGSKINLQVDGGATLMALPYGTYPAAGTNFITVPSGASNVAITGAGTIDGNGAAWWTAYASNSSLVRPRLIQFTNASNVLVSGVTLQNSPQFHLALSNANNNVTVSGVTISASSTSPNTDGIDPSGSNILIQNCNISVGDDNIAIKSSGAPGSNVTVSYCTFGTGHGLSVGGQTNFGLNGLTVNNCTFNGTTSGFRLKADATEGGLVQNLTYTSNTMTNVAYPIVFYSYYNELGTPGTTSSGSEITPAKVQTRNAQALGGSAIPQWKNITIDTLTATGATGYSIIWGLPTANGLISGVTLKNVSIAGAHGLKVYNAGNVQFTGTTTFSELITYNAQVITTQPQSPATAPAVGGTVTFTVVTAGTSGVNGTAPAYQWNFNNVPLANGTQPNASVVAGATSATLTITNLGTGNIGADASSGYSCTVTSKLDGYASAIAPDSLPISGTSGIATLTVTGGGLPPTIATQPANVDANIGTAATFTVAASSDSAVTDYEWQKQNADQSWSDVASGASASYGIAHVATSDAGTYRVLVWNTNGATTSNPVTLTVHLPPTITQQPVGPATQTVAGSTVTLTVVATGEGTLTYQWYKDGNALSDAGHVSGSATATLTLSTSTRADNGSYTVAVTNAVGTVTSNAVAVSVFDVPLAPVANAATAITSSRFFAGWNAAATATGYRLDVASDSDFTSFVPGFQNLDVGTDLGRYVGNLSAATNYYYRVRAVNAVGASANSVTIAVTTLPFTQAPAIVSPSSTIFTVGLASSFTVVATGTPTPAYAATGLPAWATLNATTGVIAGTAPAGTAGAQIQVSLTASNGVAPAATQLLTLIVQAAPAGDSSIVISTLAGQALSSGTTDGAGSAARFKHVAAVSADTSGNVYVADSDSHTIRRIDSTGNVTTVAGTAGSSGTTSGTALGVTKFNTPSGLVVDFTGNVYIADTLNHTIRYYDATKVTVSTLYGKAGTAGSADGVGTALFSGPQGLAIHGTSTSDGSIYVADTNNHTIRRINIASGEVTTVAGAAGIAGSADGVGSAARFNYPTDVAVDRNGTVYVADTDNNAIRVIATTGTVRTLAGLAGASGAADGAGNAARFNHPSAIAVDSSFNVYVLDSDNHTIRKIAAASGDVTTIAGAAGTAGSADGTGGAARFNVPTGLTQASTGEFYIADTNNFTVRKGVYPAAPVITTQPQGTAVTAGASVQLFVVATGQPAPTYQWMFNGAAISGATSSTLTLSSIQVLNSGQYTVVVANSSGSVTSNVATVTVSAPNASGGVTGGGGGGGAPGLYFYAALALLGLARWFRSLRNR